MRNVELIKKEGIREIIRMPREVRKELNEAVKAGILCRIPKARLCPEIYCLPELKEKALEIRREKLKKYTETLMKVLA